MWIDFHVHGRLTKKSDFDLEYFMTEIDCAKENGLDAFVLSEHFNSKDYYKMYKEMEDTFKYVEDHYLINDFKVFMGLEVDVQKGGHVILVSKRENILEVRKCLDEYTDPEHFISMKVLLDLADEYNCIKIGAHPFRGEHPLAIKQDIEQLERLDALDLNATDVFNKGLEETQNELFGLSKKLGIPITTGSDTHYPIQLGSVKTKLNNDCNTIADINEQIQNNGIKAVVSNVLDVKVFASKITKSYLKSLLNNQAKEI